MSQLESHSEITHIGIEVDLKLEIKEICERSLRTGGPAFLMEKA
jgi:UbiD family decarboxylase